MGDENRLGTGDPASVQRLADAAKDTATRLDKLRAMVDTDVKHTVPDLWKGQSSGALAKLWELYQRGLTVEAELHFSARLASAAEMMALAKRQLASAEQYISEQNLVLDPDKLTVTAYDSSDPYAEEYVANAVQLVDKAIATAERAREEIRDANAEYQEERDEEFWDNVLNMGQNLAMGGGMGRIPRMRRPRMPRPKAPRPRRERPLEDSDRLYGPEHKLRLPPKNAGSWSGTPGDSVWTPNRPGDYGLRPGESIRFHEGVPDFAEHAPLMPDGGEGTLSGLKLTGNPSADRAAGDAALANRLHWSRDEVARWRQNNDFEYHHYSDNELQVVPGRIHRSLTHQGSASELR